MQSLLSPSVSLRPVQVVVDKVKESVDNLVSSLEKTANVNGGSVMSPKPALTNAKSKKGSPIKSCSKKQLPLLPNPRSAEEFQLRINTFNIHNWFGKPMCLSPPFLAQFGWECIQEDVVKCNTCSALQYFRLPLPSDDNYAAEIVKGCKGLRSGHFKMCAWPSSFSSPCQVAPFDESFLSDDNKRALLNDFCQRVKGLKTLTTSLPYFTHPFLTELGLSKTSVLAMHKYMSACSYEDMKESLKNEDVAVATFSDDIIVSCMVLAMCGWSKSSTTNLISLVTCKETNRNAGLWNFHSIADEKVGVKQLSPSKANKEPSPKRRKTRSRNDVVESSSKAGFHPLEENYRWSPWSVVLHSTASALFFSDPLQNAVENHKNPGWQVIKNLLFKFCEIKNASESAPVSPCKATAVLSPTKTPTCTAFKQAVSILDTWSSPIKATP